MPLEVARSLGEWRDAAALARRETGVDRTVLTIGNFDGVHLGHREILRRVVECAKKTVCLTGAVTFDPHPLKILRPADAPAQLSTLQQRLLEMDRLGVEAVLVLPFTLEIAKLSPEDFVRTILVETMRVSTVFVGENFRFGNRAAGNVKALRELGQRFGYGVEIVEPVVLRGEIVSSTAVRVAVAEGRVGSARQLLGRPFALTGKIRPGTGTGSRAVFPTLNLAPEQEIVPAMGVYVTETFVDGRGYRSATNVGVRPTFNGSALSIESHLFDFDQRMTEGPMQVWFWKRLRGEQKFSGAEALRAQIARDLERCRAFFRHLDRQVRLGKNA
jgi:riboflavin kinase/FMN adenylyltransferase